MKKCTTRKIYHFNRIVLQFLVCLLFLQPLNTAYAINTKLVEKGFTMYDTSSIICGNTTSTTVAVNPATSSVDTKTVSGWVDAYGQLAYNTGIKYGIPYVAILAQGALESGWGASGLTKNANNFFGIKAGTSWTGPVLSLSTNEEASNGSTYSTTAAFRKYSTPQDGFDGYGQFITENSRYAAALNFPNDPAKYIQAIKDAGYATDSAYVSKNVGLQQQIESYIASNTQLPPSSSASPSTATTAPLASVESPVPEESLIAVVNKKHPNNPIDYKPSVLVSIAGDDAGDQLRKEAADGLVKMMEAATRDSVTLKPSSAYRSYERQKELYDEDVKTKGKTIADKYTARPGYSEHQTGLALDFSPVDASFENTPEYKWLRKNAQNYGFVLRYPKGKTSITGYEFEPWHWRFIGEEESKAMFTKGTATLEDFFGVTGGLYADMETQAPTPPSTTEQSSSPCNNQSTAQSSLTPGTGQFTDVGNVNSWENVISNAEASSRLVGDSREGDGVCAAIVSRVWRGANIGWGNHTDPKTGSTNAYAVTLWYEVSGTYGHADRNVKVGSILLYESSNQSAGHTAIYLGKNKVLNDGYIRDASFLEKDWGLKYLGWVDPNDLGWTSVRADDDTIKNMVMGL